MKKKNPPTMRVLEDSSLALWTALITSMRFYYITKHVFVNNKNGEDFSPPLLLHRGSSAVGFTALVTTERCFTFAALGRYAPNVMSAIHIRPPYRQLASPWLLPPSSASIHAD